MSRFLSCRLVEQKGGEEGGSGLVGGLNDLPIECGRFLINNDLFNDGPTTTIFVNITSVKFMYFHQTVEVKLCFRVRILVCN